MAVKDGQWIMRGMEWDNPYRIRTWKELVNWINEVGFLPLFANEVEGFSAEEHVSPDYWWTGIREEDPWEWREIIAADHQVAYGKFFGQKAGFISIEWLPYFANFRRSGYDFDARYEDGLASRREKLIMDLLTRRDEDGDVTFHTEEILSTDLKKMAGFGKNKEKNYPGIVTGLQMQTYLVITNFHRRMNKRGEEYGMPVSVMLPPEAIWGYETVTSAYNEKPSESWQKVFERVKEHFQEAEENAIIKLIGRKPAE
ncbi:hypothetical protein QYZ88_007585 [Lachnospiraceae bacterium C1.1]|nr:hypothetical protein [Lachnospiraceae bacterium C1.1]